MGQYDPIAGPGGEVDKIATELAGLNKTISSFITNGDAPNDLMDRRDLLIDQLSELRPGLGRAARRAARPTSPSSTASTGTTYPIVTDKTATWAGPPAGELVAGRPDGRPARPSASPAARSTATWRRSTRSPARSPTAVNAAYGGTFFDTGAPAGRDARRRRPDPGRPGEHPLRHRRRRLQRPRARGLAAERQRHRRRRLQGVRRQGRRRPQRGHRACRPTPRCSTDSVENRRQSVAGVSMDEEMSNLVRFQRAYQASARAMSTMDEMLDVLINRTGKVGL